MAAGHWEPPIIFTFSLKRREQSYLMSNTARGASLEMGGE